MNRAILLAAGSSQRAGIDKLWADLWGEPVWMRSLEALLRHEEIHEVWVVGRGEHLPRFQEALDRRAPSLNPLKKPIHLLSGGPTRMASFKAALSAIQAEVSLTDEDLVLDHNAANPLLIQEELTAVLQAAKETGAAALSHPNVDTVLRAQNGHYVEIIDREGLRLMQTPQAVLWKHLKELELLDTSTDLASALVSSRTVAIVDANAQNKKITNLEDIKSLQSFTSLGEDSHRFSDEGTLTLGGLKIPGCPAMIANSDGDVVLHAIGRAMAQACGESFSEHADPQVQNGIKDSHVYLDRWLPRLELLHVALQIEAKKPIIKDLPLGGSLSKILKIPEERIHLSAMTGEDLTAFGRGEGVRCLCLLTLRIR